MTEEENKEYRIARRKLTEWKNKYRGEGGAERLAMELESFGILSTLDNDEERATYNTGLGWLNLLGLFPGNDLELWHKHYVAIAATMLRLSEEEVNE